MNAEEKAGRKPPRKQKGQCTGPRRLAGEVLDAAAAAKHYGGTERLWYSRAARRLVPFRKWGGRLVFLRSELDRFFSESLSGCSIEEAQANDMARRKEEQ